VNTQEKESYAQMSYWCGKRIEKKKPGQRDRLYVFAALYVTIFL
jgi:hypothetical protein